MRSAIWQLETTAALVGALLLLSSCNGGHSDDELSCVSSPNLNLEDRVLIAGDSRQRALIGIGQVRKVASKAKTAWFGTGALSDTFGRIGGTEAITVRAEAKQLSAMVANQRAVDMVLSMDGNNLLPKDAGWACEKLAVSVASLDTGQSDEQFVRNFDVVEEYLRTVYEANGGNDLDADLAALGVQ